MLVVGLAIFSVVWSLWLEFMIFHSTKWNEIVDRHHARLKDYGFSFPWMQRLEKGLFIKAVVALTVFLCMVCVALLLTQSPNYR